MSEFCLKSLRRSLGSLKVKMIVLLDSCPPEYMSLFKKYFTSEELDLISLDHCGNHGTFKMQIELLLKQKYSELVYFAEDDYFYLPDEFEQMVLFAKNCPEAHFVTPYDHNDYYFMDFHVTLNKNILFYGNKHWQTAATTCLTFLTSKKVLAKTKNVFMTYFKGNLDNAVWISLTKSHILNPFAVLRYFFRWLGGEKLFLGMIKNSWIHCWKQNLFGKKWRLWVPVPAVGTHLESGTLSPGIPWKEIFEKEMV